MKCWWGIRHVRWWFLARRVWAWAEMMHRLGLGMGYPNPADLHYLDMVWRGLL